MEKVIDTTMDIEVVEILDKCEISLNNLVYNKRKGIFYNESAKNAKDLQSFKFIYFALPIFCGVIKREARLCYKHRGRHCSACMLCCKISREEDHFYIISSQCQ